MQDLGNLSRSENRRLETLFLTQNSAWSWHRNVAHVAEHDEENPDKEVNTRTD